MSTRINALIGFTVAYLGYETFNYVADGNWFRFVMAGIVIAACARYS